MKIKAKLDDRFDYRGTLFEDIFVTVPEKVKYQSVPDAFSQLLEESLGGLHPSPAPNLQPRIDRTFILSDGRYNPISQSWFLGDFIDRLKIVHSFGPINENTVEDHLNFTIERFRPEDDIILIKNCAVHLKEWLAEPIYFIDQFEMLEPAINVMEEIRIFLQQENLA